MFEGYEIASVSVKAADLALRAQAGQAKGLLKAQVVEVSQGKAVLNIEGRTVTVETNAQLTPNAEYDVMVKGFSGNKVQLQIVTGQAAAAQQETPSVRTLTDAEIPSRLMGFDLPEHPLQVPMARSLMNAGLPVTRENMLALIQAAPQQATEKELDFLVSMMKSGLDPSREALRLMPLLDSETQALPENMARVFEFAAKNPDAFQKVFELADGIRSRMLDTLPVRNLDTLLLNPDTDSLSAAADKLQAIGRQFFTASEARLAFLDSLQAAISTQAEGAEAIAKKLATLLKLIPQEPPSATNTLLDQAIKNTANLIKNLPLPEASPAVSQPQAAEAAEATSKQAAATLEGETPENIRSGLTSIIEQSLQLDSPEKKYFAIREAVTEALIKMLSALSAAEAGPEDALLPQKFQQLPDNLSALMNTINQIATQQQQSVPGTPVPQTLLAQLAEDLAPILTMRFSGAALPETAALVRAAQDTVSAQQSGQAETFQRVQQLMRHAAAPALQQELQQLAAHIREAGDLRAALSLLAQSAASQQQDASTAATNLARNLQLATLSNLIAHNGAAPTEAFVTYLPIQVGDRVEIGRLKVYRNPDAQARKGKGAGKEIDPNNASLVIFLDTKFIGHSIVKINTFNKKLICAIEVENKRIKKALDKYIAELRTGLENTSYDIENVSVNVSSPRAAARARERAADVPQITTIDMKI